MHCVKIAPITNKMLCNCAYLKKSQNVNNNKQLVKKNKIILLHLIVFRLKITISKIKCKVLIY